MGFENRNTLIFDEEGLDNKLRSLIQELIVKDECYSIFDTDIELKPLDSEVREDGYFPCITLGIFNQGIDKLTSDSLQLQNRTKFTIEINVYTVGNTKKKDNQKLSALIEQCLQESLGLNFLQNLEVNSEISGISRRLLRATNIIDNVNGIIYNY